MPGVNTGIVAFKNCSGDDIISFKLRPPPPRAVVCLILNADPGETNFQIRTEKMQGNW